MGKLLHFEPRSRSPISIEGVHAVPGTDSVIFGISNSYSPDHTAELEALAKEFGADFHGLCFGAPRRVVESHPRYVDVVLYLAGFVGMV